jgi:hypothetical protein
MTTIDSAGNRGRPSILAPVIASLGIFAATLAGMPAPALADPEAIQPPTRNRVWAGCQLDYYTAEQIRSAIAAGTGMSPYGIDVSFIVVYSLSETNDGQPLAAGGSTGPIICRTDGVAIERTTEQEDLPNAADHGEDAESVDLLDVEEALALRYQVNYGEGSSTEKRFCHSLSSTDGATNQPTETNVDCFRIYPDYSE